MLLVKAVVCVVSLSLVLHMRALIELYLVYARLVDGSMARRTLVVGVSVVLHILIQAELSSPVDSDSAQKRWPLRGTVFLFRLLSKGNARQ